MYTLFIALPSLFLRNLLHSCIITFVSFFYTIAIIIKITIMVIPFIQLTSAQEENGSGKVCNYFTGKAVWELFCMAKSLL